MNKQANNKNGNCESTIDSNLDRGSAWIDEPLSISVMGAGYVGLTAAAGLAELGHQIVCVESNRDRLSMIKRGVMPIYEPGLKEIVTANVANGRLRFTSDVELAAADPQLVLLCIGTPPRNDGQPDLSQLAAAGRQLVQASRTDLVFVIKSTVPPGSAEALEMVFQDLADNRIKVSVASNPEFLRESRAVEDFFNPDRVVLGSDDPQLFNLLDRIYPKNWTTIRTDRRSAELVKYASNTFLAIKISFANELAELAERVGANAPTVIEGVGHDPRIGNTFMQPGPGYGGSCLPKDIAGFIAVGAGVGLDLKVASAARNVNDRRPDDIANRIAAAIGDLTGTRICVLGLSFKAGTDDTRFSPAIDLIGELAGRGAVISCYDPMARLEQTISATIHDDPYSAAAGCSAVVIATGWSEFGELDFALLSQLTSGVSVFDTVGILDPVELASHGLDLYGLGRGLSTAFHPVVWQPLLWTI